MDTCNVLIVGGGPAGSSCARRLQEAHIDTIVLDKSTFPRQKVCGGWITPEVVRRLEINLPEYANGRVLQSITGFCTGRMGDAVIETDYGHTVSYGIRRLEFDDYLLHRCGARLLMGSPVKSIIRSADTWIVNGNIQAQLIVGAGGHFCPVARLMGAKPPRESAVAAQEVEFEMSSEQQDSCTVKAAVPELYFCSDMKGYGWCFRKGPFLNIGLGRLDPHSLPTHVAQFLRFLTSSGKVPFDLPLPMKGHAYLTSNESRRSVAGSGFLLIGDAAGLAYSLSGEGIYPAIESGLLAAEFIIAANGIYTHATLEPYREMLGARLKESRSDYSTRVGKFLPEKAKTTLARMLLARRWFSRYVVLDGWFLHRN